MELAKKKDCKLNDSDATGGLLSPFTLGDLSLANRVVMAPLTRSRAGQQRLPNALMAKYYAQRSSAGLIISEATTVSSQANGWDQSPGIYTDEMAECWKPVVQAVHDKGGKIFMQLWHCGRASHSDFHSGQPAVAPSTIAIQGDGIRTPLGKKPYEVPRALETNEIPLIVEDYRRATRRAKAAGFDGVEIHSANGYLLDQFLQSKTNHRDDIYGGSIENRYRLLGQVVAAVTSEMPRNRVAVRLAPNGVFNDMGSPDFREQFTFVARQLDPLGLAYLHVMDGLAFGFHELGQPMTLAEFRQCYSGTLMGNCGYTQPDAQAAIVSGDADLIAFGRPFISNPDLVQRFENNWPLAELASMSVWYSYDAAGYSDFPAYEPA